MYVLFWLAKQPFVLLFLVVAVSLAWMHLAIGYMEKRRLPELAGPQYLPEADILGPVLPDRPAAGEPATGRG